MIVTYPSPLLQALYGKEMIKEAPPARGKDDRINKRQRTQKSVGLESRKDVVIISSMN
jgi:hypothetical protein